MSDPDNRRQSANPYPPHLERRVSDIEGWRGSVDEWRKGIDAWRSTIEREGLVTAVAVIGTKMDQTQRQMTEVREDLREMKGDLEALQDDRNVRRGVTLTGRTALLYISGATGILTIIGLLIALLSGGGGS